jgi:hypothetical protein
MKLEDALYNWLQARLVVDARPHDEAARETLDFFSQLLKEDHGVREVAIRSADDQAYVLQYVTVEGAQKDLRMDKDSAEWLLREIEANPNFSLDER